MPNSHIMRFLFEKIRIVAFCLEIIDVGEFMNLVEIGNSESLQVSNP